MPTLDEIINAQRVRQRATLRSELRVLLCRCTVREVAACTDCRTNANLVLDLIEGHGWRQT